MLGHDFPVYLKFRGGKGISTSFGVIIGLCSFPFNGTSVWLRILPECIRYFQVQSCGRNMPGWHDACHLDDDRATAMREARDARAG